MCAPRSVRMRPARTGSCRLLAPPRVVRAGARGRRACLSRLRGPRARRAVRRWAPACARRAAESEL